MSATLEFVGTGYRYGARWAVRHVRARLPPGITGLLGRNGAGKTTLMRLALGLLVPHEGSVRLLGHNPIQHPGQRLGAGYLPQHFDPPRGVRVGEYLECLAQLSGLGRRAAGEAVGQALAATGLSGSRHTRLGALSGGMLRRVGVAQAIMHRPAVVLLDEPGTGLDPEERMRLYETLRSIAATRPVLVSTHLVDEIEREADSVWMLRQGELVWQGNVAAAVESAAGLVHEGILPPGTRPAGHVVGRRPVAGGTMWRVLGTEESLQTCAPTLLDAYILHAGQGEEQAP